MIKFKMAAVFGGRSGVGLWLMLLFLFGDFAGADNLDELIYKLARNVEESQIKKESKFLPPFSYYKQVGVYPSNIRVNFNSFPESGALRESFAFFDDNAFVTLWTTIILLEAQRFVGAPPPPTDSQLHLALEAISSYHDKNRLLQDGVLVFWPQTYNSTTKAWKCGPVNLGALAKMEQEFNEFMQNLLNELGLGFLWKKIGSFLDSLDDLLLAFNIPADFDDTFVNLGLGAMLTQQRFKFPNAHIEWTVNNTHLESVFENLKKYAYRPFSDIQDSNIIDPRTFFYMREFLYSVESVNPDLSIVPTWVMNFTEDRLLYSKGIDMPFHLNNVDLTVSANVLYGITAAILFKVNHPPEAWFDEELQRIYLNTSSLISWEIAHNFSSRPDLALTYYPSVFNFLWFASRSVELLNSAPNLPFPVMNTVKEILTSALRGPATKYILEAVQHDQGLIYFEEFLGNKDESITGKPVESGEDRIMVTSMAINVLCYTWSENQKLIDSTPEEVRAVVRDAAKWLVKYTLSGKYKLYNSFFSGSVKGMSDLPYFFPSNYAKYLNGSDLPDTPSAVGFDAVIGVQGMIPEEEYNKLIQEDHYGVKTPVDFHGYNQPGDTFPFWSSQPLTESSVLLALTQYRHYFVE